MSDFGLFNTHRTWEDWCGMLLWLADRDCHPGFPSRHVMT